MRQPRNGVGFTTAGAMLNKILFASALNIHGIEQCRHHRPLVIAREDHGFFAFDRTVELLVLF